MRQLPWHTRCPIRQDQSRPRLTERIGVAIRQDRELLLQTATGNEASDPVQRIPTNAMILIAEQFQKDAVQARRRFGRKDAVDGASGWFRPVVIACHGSQSFCGRSIRSGFQCDILRLRRRTKP